jgi:hypothetical protein
MSPRPKKAWQVGSIVKVMLALFLNCEGKIHHKFLRHGQTANKESEGDENAERSSEEKKAWFMEGKKMTAPSLQCSSAFLPSYSRFSHKT